MHSRRIKLTVQYDGTAYHGWQKQPGVPTLQGTLEEALAQLTGKSIEIVGSSRTDAGVHARGQVAHFDLESPIPTENLPRALNALLPDDIAVIQAEQVEPTFDAISSTFAKWYRYTLNISEIRPVFEIRYCWHRPGRLDTAAMQQAASYLVGQHDFKSFACAADSRQNSIRTILAFQVSSLPQTIFFDVCATGFLYNMVRNMVGTLVEIGRGRWQTEQIQQILAAADRAVAGPIAPAAGLCLMQIFYSEKEWLTVEKNAFKAIVK